MSAQEGKKLEESYPASYGSYLFFFGKSWQGRIKKYSITYFIASKFRGFVKFEIPQNKNVPKMNYAKIKMPLKIDFDEFYNLA